MVYVWLGAWLLGLTLAACTLTVAPLSPAAPTAGNTVPSASVAPAPVSWIALETAYAIGVPSTTMTASLVEGGQFNQHTVFALSQQLQANETDDFLAEIIEGERTPLFWLVRNATQTILVVSNRAQLAAAMRLTDQQSMWPALADLSNCAVTPLAAPSKADVTSAADLSVMGMRLWQETSSGLRYPLPLIDSVGLATDADEMLRCFAAETGYTPLFALYADDAAHYISQWRIPDLRTDIQRPEATATVTGPTEGTGAAEECAVWSNGIWVYRLVAAAWGCP